MKNDFLSDYDIKETIGKGTFSVVKLGINKKTDEKVAIKILKKKKILLKADKSRLEREISILKKLNHINVIKNHKINEDQDNYYIVMEYCENGELFNYIVAHQRLDEEEASYFFYQLINGLDYIHHKNIVHRDLKPENLLLGKGNILKIVDFGLSNYYDKEKLLSTPCGSPCYASPEMVCGNKYNGFLIDIWACGIIIFAMICGFLPFEDINNEILFKKIMKCKVEYPEFLSNTVVDIMKKILVIDTKKRMTIPEIRKHPFYLKGKNIFEKKHNNLVYQVERIISENNIESKEIYTNKSFSSNINKSKSTNFIDNDNIIDKKIEYKKCLNKIINKRTTNKENNSFKNNSNKGLISKKFHISINSKDKIDKNNNINKIKSINYEIEENNVTNDNEKDNNILFNNIIIKEIDNKIDDQKYKEPSTSKVLLNNLSPQNKAFSDNFHSEINQNVIEGYEDIMKKKNIIHQVKAKINLSLLQKLLKKEKSLQYFKDKNLINSPIKEKNKEKTENSYNIAFDKNKKKENENQNPNSKTDYHKKTKSLTNEKIKNNEKNLEPTDRSEKSNDKSILSYNNLKKYDIKENNINSMSEKKLKIEVKNHNLELIKYGISNKDFNEIISTNNKKIKNLYELNTTKNKQIINFENFPNNENNTYNFNTGNSNNIHIKSLRILNNNNYNNIKNITNINNIKNINNIIICNTGIKSFIKDAQYLKKLNKNNDLPNIKNNAYKEIKTFNHNYNNLMPINMAKINDTSIPTNNNILIPKILMSNENSNYNNYNTTNLSKNNINKKLSSINKSKKNSVNNLIKNYRKNSSSIGYLNKKVKKQISERNINSYGHDFINVENENKSIHKRNNNIELKNKNSLNMNKIKANKLDPFTYGRNNENLVTLKKINYNNNFNTAQNNQKNSLLNNNNNK